MTTPTNEAGHGLPELPAAFHDDFKGDDAKLIESAKALISLSDSGSMAPHGIGGHARTILSAFIVRTESALALSRGVPESGRYFVDGPQGSFFTSDKTFADLFVREVDDPDDWTITDLSNPTGTAPAAAGAQGEDEIDRAARRMGDSARSLLQDIAQQPAPQPAAADGGVRERDLLADAIAQAGIKCGLLRPDIEGLTGPQLLMVCQDMADALSSHRQAGDAVAFVPVHPRNGPLWGDTYRAGDAADGRSPHYERMPLYTAPPPGPDLSEFKELAERWRANGHPYVSDCADELIALVEKGAGNG